MPDQLSFRFAAPGTRSAPTDFHFRKVLREASGEGSQRPSERSCRIFSIASKGLSFERRNYWQIKVFDVFELPHSPYISERIVAVALACFLSAPFWGAREGEVSGATFVYHVKFFTPAGHKDLDGGGCSRVASSHSTRFSRLSAHIFCGVRER